MVKTRKLMKRILVLTLVTVMVLENGVLDVLGASPLAGALMQEEAAGADVLTGISLLSGETAGEEQEVEESYIIAEDKDKRERSVKHFLTDSGAYMAVMYPDAVHYEENGVWEEIDNTLILSEGQDDGEQSYVNHASSVDIEIACYSDAEELVSIQTAAGTISWSLVTEDAAVQEESEAVGAEEEAVSSEGTQDTAAQALENEEAEESEESEAAAMETAEDTEGVTEGTVSGETEGASEPAEIPEEPESSGEEDLPDTHVEEMLAIEEEENKAAVSEFLLFAGESSENVDPAAEEGGNTAGGQEDAAALMSLASEEAEGTESADTEGTEAEDAAAEHTEDGGPALIPVEGSREGKSAEAYNQEQMAVSGLTSGGTYEDILPGVDIQYVLESLDLKENIILKSAAAVQEQYTFRVSHAGMDMVLAEDGSVIIRGRGEGAEAVYTFMRPFMYDSAGVYSGSVEYILTPEGTEATVLSICPDTQWLLAEERSYPVTIDPVTETSRKINDIVDTFIMEKDPNGTKYDEVWQWQFTTIGYESSSYGKCHMLIKFPELPKLESGDLIYKGIFMMYQSAYSTYGATEFYVGAHEITGSWNRETVTWNADPDYDETILDYQVISDEVIETNQAKLHQFDITSLARKWYEEPDKNNGIRLCSMNEEIWAHGKFISSDDRKYPETARPAAIFYYRNTAGLEDYWSYHSIDAGRAGTAYVNDFNGNLVFIHEDAATIGNVLPVSVSHVYNLCRSKDTAASGDSYGNGWSLNVLQRLDTTGMTDFPYVYTDADGTKHYFYKDKEDGNKLKDEDGLGLTITQESAASTDAAAYRIITCKDKSKMAFDSTGRLSQTIDTNGNTISYSFEDNKLSKVTDGNGKTVSLTYTNGRLSAIRDDDAVRETAFAYDSAGNLTTITHPDGTVTQYTYSGGKLIRAQEVGLRWSSFFVTLTRKIIPY